MTPAGNALQLGPEEAFRRMIAEMAERRAAAVEDTEQLTPAARTDEAHGRAATDGN